MSSAAAKFALVTGAGSGIGRATALALAADGFAVALAGRRQEALEETAALAAKDARLLPIPTDVGDPESVARLFDGIRREFGRLDLLFNNAGIGASTAPIGDIVVAEWIEVVRINLTGYFLCTREAFRLMREQAPQGGRIINNGSIAAHTPRPGTSPYTATKHGITGLTKSTSLDGRPFDIACGQIDIGNALTKRTVGYTKGTARGDGTVAPEPTMDPAEAARSVVHMAGLPLGTNVLFLTVMATNMPYVGRG